MDNQQRNNELLTKIDNKMIDWPESKEDNEAYQKRIQDRADESYMVYPASILEAIQENATSVLADLVKAHHEVGGKEEFIANELIKVCEDYFYSLAKTDIDEE